MDRTKTIVIIGAGVFGLSTALELALKGYENVVVLDRNVPPVPDGSSVDISRIVRFDYGDPEYHSMAREAYEQWNTSPMYKGMFFKTPYALVAGSQKGGKYVEQSSKVLSFQGLPFDKFSSPEQARARFPALTGALAQPSFSGYYNSSAGWADAELAMILLKDRCIELGVSFINGKRGTAVGFVRKATDKKKISGLKTLAGVDIEADLVILATGSWSSALVPMYNSNLATGQVLAFVKLNETEMNRLKDMPIYQNFETGWFCFPPHQRTGFLKMAIHGYGYTVRGGEGKLGSARVAAPPMKPRAKRTNFVPKDAEARLRLGLKEILPELATRKFDNACVCWYGETPTGDFILDYHPDYENLFLATGGSGHAFKFLPVLGKYIVASMQRELSQELLHKFRFHSEYETSTGAWRGDGDGSRGGPSRRDFTEEEKARL